MRIAIMTIGSRGDVQPYIALGTALKANGHTVRIVTGEGFGAMIDDAGLETGRIGIDFEALIADPELKAALRSPRALMRAYRSSGELIDRTLKDSWHAIGEADLIIYHPKMLSAPHIAQKLGCPAILASVVPMIVPTGAFESPLLPIRSLGPAMNRLGHKLVLYGAKRGFGGRVRAFRQQVLDLPERSDRGTDILTVNGSPVPSITGVSRALVPMPPDAAQHAAIGYWFSEPQEDFRPEERLANFLSSGPAPIYFGFGSMIGTDPSRTAREIIAALAATGQRGILASGWGGLEASDCPPNCIQIGAAPHSWLFPRCAAVVHHGGVGTTHEGLRWGRPTLICPVFGDQMFWGRRVADIGAGPPPLKEKRFERRRLADALGRLLSNECRIGAERAAEMIRAEPGAKGAADFILGLTTR